MQTAKNGLIFEQLFKRQDLRLKTLYTNFERDIKTALNNLELNYDQAQHILEIARHFLQIWDEKLVELIDHVKHITTKILFIDLNKEILELINTNRESLAQSLSDINTIWIKVGDRGIIQKVIRAFMVEQTVHNKTPYNQEGNLWKETDIVTEQELGIKVPNIPEINYVTINYQIVGVDLDQGLVEIAVAVSKGESEMYQKQHINVKIYGFIDMTKYDHVKLMEFIDKYQAKQITNRLNQTIFSWKIGQKDDVNKDLLGIEEPENEIKATLEYTILEIKYQEGIVKVRLDASKHDVIMSQYIEVSGFYQADSELKKLQENLTNISKTDDVIDLKHQLKFDDNWSAVTFHIKDLLDDKQSKIFSEIVENLTFSGEAQCDDFNERIVTHIDLNETIIQKTMRIQLGSDIIGVYRFSFKNYFDVDEMRKQAVEDFSKRFISTQNTKNPHSVAPLDWTNFQFEGIGRESLGIIEPANTIQADIKYFIKQMSLASGSIIVGVNISAFNHLKTIYILINNFSESKRIFNKVKRDLEKFAKSQTLINLDRQVWSYKKWYEVVNLIIEKLIEFEPFKLYREDYKYTKKINISDNPVTNDIIFPIEKTENFSFEKTAKNFNIRIGQASLGTFTLYLTGFKGAVEFTYHFPELDNQGNPKKYENGSFVKPTVYLETGPSNDKNSTSRTFVILDNFKNFADSWEEFTSLYQQIIIEDTNLKIKWATDNIEGL